MHTRRGRRDREVSRSGEHIANLAAKPEPRERPDVDATAETAQRPRWCRAAADSPSRPVCFSIPNTARSPRPRPRTAPPAGPAHSVARTPGVRYSDAYSFGSEPTVESMSNAGDAMN